MLEHARAVDALEVDLDRRLALHDERDELGLVDDAALVHVDLEAHLAQLLGLDREAELLGRLRELLVREPARVILVELIEREEHAVARDLLRQLARVEIDEVAGLEELLAGDAPVGSCHGFELTVIEPLARELLRLLEVELVRDRRARAHRLFSKKRCGLPAKGSGSAYLPRSKSFFDDDQI